MCDKFPLPDPNTTNHCNDYYAGSTSLDGGPGEYRMLDFCSYAGIAGATYREEWCSKLGSPGEWGVLYTDDDNGDCFYNSCNPYQNMGEGYCGGCSGIRGSSVTCTRLQFNGDGIRCCFKDKVCTSPGTGNSHTHSDAPSVCFSDTDKRNTCSPCHRDITSNDFTKADGSAFTCSEKGQTPCQELAIQYCSGADLSPGDISWTSRWTADDVVLGQPQCIYALKRNLFKEIGCVGANIPLTNQAGLCQPITAPLSSEGTQWATTLMSSVLERYNQDGYVLGTNPGDVGYNPFQDTLYQLSCAVPVVMQQPLTQACSIYTAEGVSRNPTIANFCGCYLPSSEYTKYVDYYQINKECTPTCNRLTNIPIVSGDNQAIRCNQSSCIIDDITINIISSNIGQEGIGISQVCGNCSGTGNNTASCSCIVSSDVITVVNSNIGGINISEQCSSSLCSIANPDPLGTPKQISIPCSQLSNNPSDQFNQAVNSVLVAEAIKKQRTIAVIIVVVLIVLVILFILLSINSKKS